MAILAWITLYALPSGSRNGSRKTRIRSRWYSLSANQASGSADSPRGRGPRGARRRTPAPTRRAISTGTSTSAVPRSGCLTISTTGTARTANVMSSAVLPTGCAQRRGQRPDQHQHEAELEELGRLHGERADGIQRRAPDTVRPSMKTAGAAPSADQVERGRRPHEPPVVDAGHDEHGDEADAEPDELAHGDAAARPTDASDQQRAHRA